MTDDLMALTDAVFEIPARPTSIEGDGTQGGPVFPLQTPARPDPSETGSRKAGGPVDPRAGAGVCRCPVLAVAAGGRSGGASVASGPGFAVPVPPAPPSFPPPIRLGEGPLYDALYDASLKP